VSFAAITTCVASQRVFNSLSTQSGNFWIYPRITSPMVFAVACANVDIAGRYFEIRHDRFLSDTPVTSLIIYLHTIQSFVELL
jgi:hypothetical protein